MATNPAETYERYMVPPLFAPSAELLVDAAAPAAGERVLDVGCGTGIAARCASRRLGGRAASVVGLDASPQMLAVARAQSERAALDVGWREGRAEALPFPDASFDLALCQFALMFFEDRGRALAEMRRVLAPGGRVAVHVFQDIARHPFYEALDRSIERHLGTSAVRGIFALGDREALRALLAGAGFERVAIDGHAVTSRFPSPADFLAGEIDVDTASIPAMQALDAAARAALTAAIRGDMEKPLADVTDGDLVVLPFHTLIARGYRPGARS